MQPCCMSMQSQSSPVWAITSAEKPLRNRQKAADRRLAFAPELLDPVDAHGVSTPFLVGQTTIAA